MVKYEYSKNKDVVFQIDTDKKTVEAIIVCNQYSPQVCVGRELEKYMDSNGIGVFDEMNLPLQKYKINSRYVGKAKCHPNDTFDIEFGKKLALLRAREKFHRAMTHKLEDIHEWINGLQDRVTNRYNKCYRSLINTTCELFEIEKETGLYG